MDMIDEGCGARLTYEIPTLRPDYIRHIYSNDVHPVSILPWTGSLKLFGYPTYASIMRSDLSLVFDAVLFDRSLYNPFFNFLSSLHFLLLRAKKRGKLTGFFNVTAGPVYTDRGKQLLRELSEAMDFMTVRDQDSYDILRSIGVKNPNIFVTADAAVNARPAPADRSREILSTLGFRSASEILAININQYLDTWARAEGGRLSRSEFVSTYASALNRFLEHSPVPVLFVSTQHHDVEITQELMQQVKAPIKGILSNKDYTHTEVKGVLSEIDLLVGMRLHAMILASSALTPIVGLAYLPKCVHYFNSLGLPDHIMNFDDFSADSLYALMKTGWEQRADLKRHLQEKIPELQSLARVPAGIIAGLRQGLSVEAAFEGLQETPRMQHAESASR